MPKKSATLQYMVFALVAVAAIAFFICHAASQYQYVWHGHERADAPLYLGISNHVGYAPKWAQKAGLREGDQVLAVNDRPFRSFNTLLEQTNASRPGDPVTLLIERKGGGRSVLQFPLAPQVTGGQLTLSFKLFIFCLQVVFPGFCLLIGLWVVAAKPRDPNAWYVLGIFGFIQCFFDNHFYRSGPVLPFMSVYGDLAFIAFILSMLLFGINFPEPARLDSRYPWAKWILIVPCLVFTALDVIIDLGRNIDLRISSWIPAWLHTLDHRTESAIGIICICLFFALLFPKYFTATTGDAKRRLGILVWGAEIGLTPIFIGVVIAQIRNRSSSGCGSGLVFLVLLCLCSSSFPCPWPTSLSCSVPWMYASCYARGRSTRSPAVRSMVSASSSVRFSGFTLFQLVNNPQHSSNALTWARRPYSAVSGHAVWRPTAPLGLDRPQILPRGLLHRAGPDRAFRAGRPVHRDSPIAGNRHPAHRRHAPRLADQRPAAMRRRILPGADDRCATRW